MSIADNCQTALHHAQLVGLPAMTVVVLTLRSVKLAVLLMAFSKEQRLWHAG